MLISQPMQHEVEDELEGLVSSQNCSIIITDETWRNASQDGVLGWRAAGWAGEVWE